MEVVELIPALRAFARTFCSKAEDADDLVQETLTKALGNLDKFEPGTRLKSWLFTIMRNSFFTNIRRRGRENVGLPDDIAEYLTVEASQEWSVEVEDVRRALWRLPEHHREMLILIVMLGERYEDAAAICGCPMGTVKSRLNRARRQLLRELGEAPQETDDREPGGSIRSNLRRV
ncbi:sigma-70 family RNA polymerase sigma factor [Rhizobium cremeum]|nr:sigma-70 family RNA polymerase sigma factor [Rhizobium cremeum]MCJ7999812.1 sigma-70 family RNA polymerase sigma factor [Rhizobium cremeum]